MVRLLVEIGRDEKPVQPCARPGRLQQRNRCRGGRQPRRRRAGRRHRRFHPPAGFVRQPGRPEGHARSGQPCRHVAARRLSGLGRPDVPYGHGRGQTPGGHRRLRPSGPIHGDRDDRRPRSLLRTAGRSIAARGAARRAARGLRRPGQSPSRGSERRHPRIAGVPHRGRRDARRRRHPGLGGLARADVTVRHPLAT